MKRIIAVAVIVIMFIFGAFHFLVLDKQSESLPQFEVTKHVSNTHYPVTVKTYNSQKQEVDMVFQQKPQRVVVNERNTLETLLALGQGSVIVETSANRGSRDYNELKSWYPDEFAKIQNIYDFDLNKETTIYLQPDLIIGWKSTFTRSYLGSTDDWKARGVNTYIVSTSNHVVPHGRIADEYQFIRDMGKIFDVDDKAEAMIQGMQDELVHVKKAIKGRQGPKVLVMEVNSRGIIYNYDDGWIIGDIVEQLGGTMPVKSRTMGAEDLISENPDVIFCVYYTDAMYNNIVPYFAQTRYNSLKAVQNQRIYPIRLDYMYTPAVKLKDCIHQVAHGLYPDIV